MKSSSFLFTWVITDSRALISPRQPPRAFSTCVSSACSAAMRFCAPRKARWISVAAVALLLMDAGVSMVPPRGARALCRVREAGASPDRTTRHEWEFTKGCQMRTREQPLSCRHLVQKNVNRVFLTDFHKWRL